MILPPSIFPERLREYLVSRECVAFIGAGFSMPAGMPGWSDLIAAMTQEASKSVATDEQVQLLADCKEAAAAGLYATAASALRRLLSQQELSRCLIGAFAINRLQRLSADERDRVHARVDNLVNGPWAGFITTNFDALIETGFERFHQHVAPFRCDGSQKSLGHVLCLPLEVGQFFVKLHGDTWADSQILSTADYVHAWLTSPRITYFLTAVMLRYRLVFIGCSLEDAVLRLRQTLWASFGGALPIAYALLPNSIANRLRRDELRESAGVESLLYSPEFGKWPHGAVDEFLAEARNSADIGSRGADNSSLSKLKSTPLEEQLTSIGAINQHLLALISRQAEARLPYAHIFEPHFQQLKQGKHRRVLSGIPEGERLYRMLFLVSLGLVQQVTRQGIDYFALTPNSLDAVRRCLSV